MRAYSPEGRLRWQLECSVFCVAAAFDPAADGAELIGKLNRYRHADGAPAGRDWQWQAVTYDDAGFPELSAGLGSCVAVRRLNGNHAEKGRQSFSFFVDDAGGIWEPQDRWGVRHLPLRGFAASGAPIYDFADETWFPRPREFIAVLRAWYFPGTDTMYLSGYTWDHPASGKEYVWGCCGRELIRYDDWTKPTRAIRCRMPFPEDSHDVKSAAVAHEAGRAFAVDKENVIFVYDTPSARSDRQGCHIKHGNGGRGVSAVHCSTTLAPAVLRLNVP